MTKNEKYIVDMYVRYFGRAADAQTIKDYGFKENGEPEKTSVILRNIIDDSDYETIGLSTEEFVNNAFQNLFGRNATTKDMNKYSKVVDAGKDLPINSIVKSATKTDKAVYNNKIAVAAKYAELGGKGDLDLSKISKGNTVDLNKVVTLTDLNNAIDKLADNSGIPSSFDGKTFVLTTSVNAGKDFTGTNKDDQFIADNTGATATSSAADTLDGGKGIDTFKVYVKPTADLKAGELPTLKNVENVVIYDNTAAAATNFTKWDTVESVYLVRDKSLVANTYTFGAKTTTVNLVDSASATKGLTFDAALTSATLGVDNVFGGATIATAAVITTGGAKVDTLTVNAEGKASNVQLIDVGGGTDTIKTLNVTGKANLTLDANSTANTAITTVDASAARGNIKLSGTSATVKTIKTGTGNDSVDLGATVVAAGTTIDLGAGNDKLIGSAAVTTSSLTVIDGGAGIDSVNTALINSGNAGQFVNFETISITTGSALATALDLDLVTKSTITSLALDANVAATVRNVKTSQSLTVNSASNSTTLVFKDVTGTADAYKINFDATNAAGIDAGTVVVDGIETVTVNSSAKIVAGANEIDLTGSTAKTLVVEGNSDLILTFNTKFGANSAVANDGLGVATIDASALTAGLKIAAGELVKIGTAEKGLTIKGGSGDDNIITGAYTKDLTIDAGAGNDTIDTTGATGKVIVNAGAGNDILTVGAVGGTFTLGAGNDKIDVTLAKGVTALTTITDAAKGDTITGLTAAAGDLFAKASITGANNLDAALGLAATANATTWFQYAGDTYIVDSVTGTLVAGTDFVVKLNGLVDLGNSSLDVSVGVGSITIA